MLWAIIVLLVVVVGFEIWLLYKAGLILEATAWLVDHKVKAIDRENEKLREEKRKEDEKRKKEEEEDTPKKRAAKAKKDRADEVNMLKDLKAERELSLEAERLKRELAAMPPDPAAPLPPAPAAPAPAAPAPAAPAPAARP